MILHAAIQQQSAATPQDAAPLRSSPQQQGATLQDLLLLRQERDMLRQERDRMAQQLELLHTLYQTTQHT